MDALEFLSRGDVHVLRIECSIDMSAQMPQGGVPVGAPVNDTTPSQT